MLHAFHGGSLEVRAAGRRRQLRGSFPYNSTAVLSSGGRNGKPRKERFAPHSLRYNIEKPDVNLRLLVGHEYSKPLADRASGSLVVRDTPTGVLFDATIAEEMESVSWVRDALAGIASGLIVGVSIGFLLPPARQVPKAEEIEEEEDEGPGSNNRGAIIRTVLDALLFELSVVTAASYTESQISLRNWTPSESGVLVPDAGLRHALSRWRA